MEENISNSVEAEVLSAFEEEMQADSVSQEAQQEEQPVEESNSQQTVNNSNAEQQDAGESETPKSESEGQQESTTETPEENAEAQSGETPSDKADSQPESTTEFNPSQYLSEATEGRIDSVEKLGEVLNQVDELNQQIEQLQGKTYKYEFTQKLEEALENGVEPSMFMAIQSINANELNDVEAISAKMKIENPDMSEDEIMTLIGYKFHQGEDEEESLQKVGAIEMKAEARKAREFINSKQEAMFARTPQQEQSELSARQEQARQENLSVWKQNSSKIASDFKKLSFEVSKDNSVDIEVSEAQQKEIASIIEAAIDASGLEYNKENIEKVRGYAEGEFIKNNINLITKRIADKVSGKVEKELLDEVTNPTSAHPQEPSSGPERKGDTEAKDDFIFSTILEQEGMV